MEKRAGLVPLAILLVVFFVLLESIDRVSPEFLRFFTAARLPYGWESVERASWVASVIGLPLTVVGAGVAIWELRRAVNELTKRPRLVIAVDGPGTTDFTIPLLRTPENNDTGMAMVMVAVANYGNKSATQLTTTIAIDGRVRSAQELGYSTPNTVAPKRDIATFLRNKQGTLIANHDEPYVHVEMAQAIYLPLVFPNEARTYELFVAVHCAEIRRTAATLRVTTQPFG